MYLINLIAVLIAAAFAVAQNTTIFPVTGILGNATIVENNPPGQIYVATLPTKSFFAPNDTRGNIKGSISASSNPNGIGVAFQVNFSNLPSSGGPFLYHIHVAPVPSSGNCTATTGHLDPFIRGETPACDASLPQTCQVGDLSGKHGKITSDPFTASYVDGFASTTDGIGAFFGNRSFVVHFANTTRITCANFELLNAPDLSNSSSVGGYANASSASGNLSVVSSSVAVASSAAATAPVTPAATPTPYPSLAVSPVASQYSGATAQKNIAASAVGVLGAVVVFALLL